MERGKCDYNFSWHFSCEIEHLFNVFEPFYFLSVNMFLVFFSVEFSIFFLLICRGSLYIKKSKLVICDVTTFLILFWYLSKKSCLISHDRFSASFKLPCINIFFLRWNLLVFYDFGFCLIFKKTFLTLRFLKSNSTFFLVLWGSFKFFDPFGICFDVRNNF